MTKTLTEQWRDGTLPDGKYYIKLEPNFTERYDVGYSEGGDFALYNIEDIEEVLAPVPSYDEYKQLVSKTDKLEKKLEIATKALKEYAKQDKWSYCSEDIDYFYSTKPGYRDAEKALEEMEGVK